MPGFGGGGAQAIAMRVGDRARVAKLVSRADLNGIEVELLSFDDGSGRWAVCGVDSGVRVLVKPDNLVAVNTPSAIDDMTVLGKVLEQALEPDRPAHSALDFSCWGCGKRQPPDIRFQACARCVEEQLPKPYSLFCSRECFKAAWPRHKQWHQQQREMAAIAAPPHESLRSNPELESLRSKVVGDARAKTDAAGLDATSVAETASLVGANFDVVRTMVSQVLHTRPEEQTAPEVELLIAQGKKAMFEDGNLKSAEKFLRKAVAASDAPRAHLYLAHVLKRANQMQAALMEYDEAKSRFTEGTYYWAMSVANAYSLSCLPSLHSLPGWVSTQAELNRLSASVLEAAPEADIAWTMRLQVLQSSGRIDEAKAAVKKARLTLPDCEILRAYEMYLLSI